MIPIKIQCGCGQRYAFDVEPIANRMPGAVACPICGVDGTSAANAILSERLQAQRAVPIAVPAISVVAAVSAPQMQVATAPPAVQPAVSAGPVRVASIAAAPAPSAHSSPPVEKKRLPGQIDPERALNEARSKILWGDDPAEASKFLMSQGFSAEEAKAAIAPLSEERKEAVRKAGVGKIFTGIGMMLVPVIAFVVFIMIGYFPIKLFGATVAIGLWGLWRAISGTIMFVSPKSEKGDVADM